jgi:hypothetical protein
MQLLSAVLVVLGYAFVKLPGPVKYSVLASAFGAPNANAAHAKRKKKTIPAFPWRVPIP